MEVKINPTSMYEEDFSHTKKKFFVCATGLYQGFLCYTAGDGIIRSEFGNPLNYNCIRKMVSITQKSAKALISIPSSTRLGSARFLHQQRKKEE